MPSSGFWHFLLWIHYLALVLWIGGIFFFSSIAAPVIQNSMTTKSIVHDTLSKILKRLNLVEIASCLLLIFTTLSSFHFVSGKDRSLSFLLLTIFTMGLITGFYAFYLTPRMNMIKEKIPSFDALSSSHAAKIEFDRLHRLYVKLMSLNLVLAMGILYSSVVLFQ